MSKLMELLGALKAVSPEHIAELDAEIAAKQAELDQLQRVRKLIVGAPARTPRQPRAGGAVSATPPSNPQAAARRLSVAKLLAEEGPMHGQVICNRLGLPIQGFTSTMNHAWFKASSSGYDLTAAGREAVKAAP